jgi:hypothetical protein
MFNFFHVRSFPVQFDWNVPVHIRFPVSPKCVNQFFSPENSVTNKMRRMICTIEITTPKSGEYSFEVNFEAISRTSSPGVFRVTSTMPFKFKIYISVKK